MSAGVRGRIGADDHGARVVRFEDEREASALSTPVLVLPLDPASCAARETAVAMALDANYGLCRTATCKRCAESRDLARAVLAALGARGTEAGA